MKITYYIEIYNSFLWRNAGYKDARPSHEKSSPECKEVIVPSKFFEIPFRIITLLLLTTLYKYFHCVSNIIVELGRVQNFKFIDFLLVKYVFLS
jgi:hypothetical protein